MSNFSIGITGLQVAQRAIDLIGTNIANASTPGYHRQDMQIAAIDLGALGATYGGGAEVKDVRRMVDVLLEQEMVRQQPYLGQTSQELTALETIEGSMGLLDSENLTAALANFFGALRQLAADPPSQILRSQAIWAADTLARQFNSLGTFLQDLEGHIVLQAQTLIDRVNNLTAEIAQLNAQIISLGVRGGNVNILADRRDEGIAELSELAEVRTVTASDGSGAVNVLLWGTPVVTSGATTELKLGFPESGKLGISAADANYCRADVEGGRLGGLIALKNQIVPDITSKLDTLAAQIVSQINGYHVQGLGLEGSFTSLRGWPVGGGLLEDWEAEISAGTIYVRVTDLNTGQAERHAIAVDPTAQTISDIAADLDAVDGLTASVADGALYVSADVGYEFDFLPGLMPQPTTSTLTGTSAPTIDGIYAGQQNRLFTCTVIGDGQIGVDAGLLVEVRNDAGELVKQLSVGQGYAAGDLLEVVDGIRLSFSAGTLNDGETFTIQALADSDTSGLLAAAGINAFFEGDSALTMGVCQDVLSNPQRLAAGLGTEAGDGRNVSRMADLGETPLAALGNVTATEYYRVLVTNVGENINVRRARQTALENVLQQLTNQRDTVSGVDVNEEAAKLLMFERMFHSMAKFMSVQSESMRLLMELL